MDAERRSISLSGWARADALSLGVDGLDAEWRDVELYISFGTDEDLKAGADKLAAAASPRALFDREHIGAVAHMSHVEAGFGHPAMMRVDLYLPERRLGVLREWVVSGRLDRLSFTARFHPMLTDDSPYAETSSFSRFWLPYDDDKRFATVCGTVAAIQFSSPELQLRSRRDETTEPPQAESVPDEAAAWRTAVGAKLDRLLSWVTLAAAAGAFVALMKLAGR